VALPEATEDGEVDPEHLPDSACRMNGSNGSRVHLRCALDLVASEADSLTVDAERIGWALEVCEEAYPDLYDDDPVAQQLRRLTAEWDEFSGCAVFDRLAAFDDAGLAEIGCRLGLAVATETARKAKY
jgi:hypothetical protein